MDVELVGVTRRFGSVVAVDDLTLSIESGCFYSLLGPSGCGKTTTLRLIAGFEQPDAGTIRIAGIEVEGVPAYRRNVNTVFQHYALFPHLDVAANVGYGLRQRRVPDAERRTRVGGALELVRLSGFEHRRTWQLSGGQQQRVALARALVNEPTVLLLDEPLGALDMKLRKEMQHELKGLQAATGITFIYVTHDQEEALTMSDRLAVMRGGRVLQEGAPRDLYEAPADRFVADFIGVSNFFPGRLVADEGGQGRGLVVEADGGPTLRAEGPRPRHVPAPGDRVVVVVRPERIRLLGRGEQGIAGRLVEATYLGDTIESRIETAALGRIVARQPNTDPATSGRHAVGDEVTVAWDETAALALASIERRSFWQASMPPLPDRRRGTLPDAADVVVVGGGYTGLAAARACARGGATTVLLEAATLGWGASTRNGGLAHPGYKWGPRELVRRYGPDTGRAVFRETLDAYASMLALIAEESIDCDLDERGHLTLAFAPSHVARLEASRASLASAGVASTVLTRERLREEIGSDAYHGALVHEDSAGIHPGKYLAGLALAAERAGATLLEGARALRIRRQADGRSAVTTSAGTILAREVIVATNGYTDGLVPALRRRIIPIGSYIIVTEPLAEDLAESVSPHGRMFIDTKNFLYYWRLTADRRVLFGGRASFLPTSVDRSAAILHRGLLQVHPQLAATRIEYAWGGNVAFTFDRMPHVGRMGRVAYAMGYCGTGVAMSTYLGGKVGEWLGGAPAPALARLRFPLVPAPYEGRPWFLPAVGEWYRLQDRLAARRRGGEPSTARGVGRVPASGAGDRPGTG